eukprot:m.36666 g.36666  ORF g.36666 m.36666 type:complete len:436 (+) comp17420_c0_seq2:216-1523(+)
MADLVHVDLKSTSSRFLPGVLGFVWGAKLIGTLLLSPVVFPMALQISLGTEQLLSVLNGIAVDATLGQIEGVMPSLVSSFEFVSTLCQTNARILLVRIVDAENDGHIWLTWAISVLLAFIFGIWGGSRATREMKGELKGKLLDGDRGCALTLTTIVLLALAWSFSNAVLDGLFNVMKMRHTLLAVDIDTRVFSFAIFRICFTLVALGWQSRGSISTTVFKRPSTQQAVTVCAVVIASVTPAYLYAVLLAFNHRGFEMYLAAAYVLRPLIDQFLDKYCSKTLGPVRVIGCLRMLILLGVVAILGLYGYLPFIGVRQGVVLGLLLSLALNRCCDTVGTFVCGAPFRTLQRPFMAFIMYDTKARYTVSKLRSLLSAEHPEAVTSVLLEHFGTHRTANLLFVSVIIWVFLLLHSSWEAYHEEQQKLESKLTISQLPKID